MHLFFAVSLFLTLYLVLKRNNGMRRMQECDKTLSSMRESFAEFGANFAIHNFNNH